jgi:hypothetical protein
VICHWLASVLKMQTPESTSPISDKKDAKTTKKSIFKCCCCTSNKKGAQQHIATNEMLSKSFLSNALDLSDQFQIIGTKLSYYNNIKKHQSGCSSGYCTCSTSGRGGFNINSNNQTSLKTSNYKNNINNNEYSFERSSSPPSPNHKINTNPSTDVAPLKKTLHNILKELRFITQKVKDDEEEEGRQLGWKFAAMVIDRLCIIVFTVATFISTIAILFTSKNFFKVQ